MYLRNSIKRKGTDDCEGGIMESRHRQLSARDVSCGVPLGGEAQARLNVNWFAGLSSASGSQPGT